jgi:hypothetical protein
MVLKEVWKRINDLLFDHFIPQILEFRGERETTGSIIPVLQFENELTLAFRVFISCKDLISELSFQISMSRLKSLSSRDVITPSMS